MIALLGAVLVALIASGSSLLTQGDTWSGLTLLVIGSLGSGTLLAAVQTGRTANKFDTREGITVRQLKQFIEQTPWITDDTKVYVGDQGINLAGSIFSCLLDGGKSLVIERKAEPGTPAVEHDLF